jgi:hypothetical protein
LHELALTRRSVRLLPVRSAARLVFLPGVVLLLLTPLAVAQATAAEAPLPEAPVPQTAAAPCPAAANSSAPSATQPGPVQTGPPQPCPPAQTHNWFSRFLNGPEVKPLTPAEKARLAMRNFLDPSNAATILAVSAINVGSDANTAYGPGMEGFAKNAGVLFTQSLTGEFFCTFLIPSLTHQDPHYHRMPQASIPRRIGHAMAQVVWTQGDDGRGMVNWGDLAGGAISLGIGNLYVPGRQTNLPASATRYGIAIGTAPIDNFVTEFLPDVARHIHVQIVVVQRVIDRIANAPRAANE